MFCRVNPYTRFSLDNFSQEFFVITFDNKLTSETSSFDICITALMKDEVFCDILFLSVSYNVFKFYKIKKTIKKTNNNNNNSVKLDFMMYSSNLSHCMSGLCLITIQYN